MPEQNSHLAKCTLLSSARSNVVARISNVANFTEVVAERKDPFTRVSGLMKKE